MGWHLLGFGDFDEAWVGLAAAASPGTASQKAVPPAKQSGGAHFNRGGNTAPPLTTPPAKSGHFDRGTPPPSPPAKDRGGAHFIRTGTAPTSDRGSAHFKRAVGTGVTTKSPHKAAVVSTLAAGQRAVEKGKQASAAAKNYNRAAHAPVVPLKAIIAKDGKAMLGAVPVPGKKPLTPQQTKAVAKHTQAIARTQSTVKALNLAAQKAQKAGEKAVKFAKAAPAFLKAKLEGKNPKTRIGMAYLGEGEPILPGEPEPSAYGGDGSDPNAGGGYPAAATGMPATAMRGEIDPLTGIQNIVVTDANGSVLYDSSQDPGLVPLPVRGQPLPQDEAKLPWIGKVPEDGVTYSGAVFPDGSVGSAKWFETPTKLEGGILKAAGNATGFIYTRRGTHYGRDQDQPRWMYQDGSDQVHDVNSDGTPKIGSAVDVLWAALKSAIPFYGVYAGPAQLAEMASGGGDTTASKVNAVSIAMGCGPLIGNPDPSTGLAGLQFAIDGGQWFWQSQYAPKSATAAADSKIVEANKALAEANAAAAVADATRRAKEAAEIAEAQAKQEAQNALAESAAASQALVEQSKQETQRQQQELDKQKAEDAQAALQARLDAEQAAAQSKVDLQAAQAEIPIAAASDQLDVDERRQDLVERQQFATAQNQLIEEAVAYNDALAAQGSDGSDGGDGGDEMWSDRALADEGSGEASDYDWSFDDGQVLELPYGDEE